MPRETPVEIRHEDLDGYLSTLGPGKVQDDDVAEQQYGVLWTLPDERSQLGANLVRLPPNRETQEHEESEVDVLLLPLFGGGTLHTEAGAVSLSLHTLTFLPRDSKRSVRSGPDGLAYLTVHCKRSVIAD